MKLPCILLLLIMAAGCVTTPADPLVWWRANTSAEQFHRDLAAAQAKVIALQPMPTTPPSPQYSAGGYRVDQGAAGITAGFEAIAARQRRDQYFTALMESKGYTRVRRSSIPQPTVK